MIRVTVWNERKEDAPIAKIEAVYPGGIEKAIAEFLACDDIAVRTAILSRPEHGLTEEVLENTDVLIWWGHKFHNEVDDQIVERVVERVHGGMGMIFLHSAHDSKPFKRLMGTTCSLQWRESGDREELWAVNPLHPIAEGVPHIVLEHEETYGEPFDIPTPDELIYLSSFSGGEVLRSGCTWRRGHGKIFYFNPGHETYPNLYLPAVQRVIQNAVHWAAPTAPFAVPKCIKRIKE